MRLQRLAEHVGGDAHDEPCRVLGRERAAQRRGPAPLLGAADDEMVEHALVRVTPPIDADDAVLSLQNGS